MLIIITILFILGNGCIPYILFQAIQPGQALGVWSEKVLDKWYNSHPLLEKFLGGCYICFSHFLALVGLGVYLFWQYHFDWQSWWNILIYFGYVPGVIIVSMLINRALNGL